jgi:putative sterol carrier protein
MRKQQYEISVADREWIEKIGWRSVDDVLAWSAGGVAAVSRSSDVVEVPVDPAFGGPTTVFVKRYRYDRFEQKVKQAFRGTLFCKSRARREFEFLTEMRRRQIPTVRPIAYGDDYEHAFLRASFLITEGAEAFQSLDLFGLDARRRHSLKRSQRRELTEGLAVTIRKMHDAGIRHGGLFWRNILVGVRPDGGFQFLLFDPDTHGRLSDSPVPESSVVADLSAFVASAIALGQRVGLVALMTAYFRVSRLTAAQRKLTSRIIERAHTLAPSERRRMAVTEAIGWLRVRSADVQRGNRSARRFNSLDEFFDRMSPGPPASIPASKTNKAIRFSFSGTNGVNDAFDRTVLLNDGRATVCAGRPSGHDLVIRTDPETWLAVISGHADAYPRMRAGRLRMEGNPTVLCTLIEHLDRKESTALSTAAGAHADAAIERESRRNSIVKEASQQPSQRNFGGKYKVDEYARYYAKKHDSSLGRRISNNFERSMIRRSLLRIQRHHPVETVLDCPSGTGRFLPTLASLNVSVIAMDTSDAVLREGRKHHALFKKPPVVLVGSALEIGLPDDAVDVVLCSRLLHHIADREERLTILREFARVARVGVVVSFFDSVSFRAWRSERKKRRTGKLGGRHAMTRAAFVDEAVGAGLKPIGMNALLRFHTEITAAAFLC